MIVEEFNSQEGFVETDSQTYIHEGAVVWNISRSGATNTFTVRSNLQW